MVELDRTLLVSLRQPLFSWYSVVVQLSALKAWILRVGPLEKKIELEPAVVSETGA